MNNVLIAPKLKIGFQKREDCFTGKLAYIIYYDNAGKLRKEKSWECWRSKDIPIEEYENTPMEGFTLNRDVKRYSGDWFSSKRTLIRVHDPRGFEFEVTTENLIAILMHTDCLRRGLIGQFVYAWSGTELILLPTNSEEYQAAKQFTENLSKKVATKELIVGASYRTKREGDVVYVGKLDWFGNDTKGYSIEGIRKSEKVHVFTSDNGKSFFSKPISFLAYALTQCEVSNYPQIHEAYLNNLYAHKIVKYEAVETKFDPEKFVSNNYYSYSSGYFILHYPNNYAFSCIYADRRWVGSDQKLVGYNASIYSAYDYTQKKNIVHTLNIETGEIKRNTVDVSRNVWYNGFSEKPSFPPDNVPYVFYDIYAVLENGEKVKIESFNDLTAHSSLKINN